MKRRDHTLNISLDRVMLRQMFPGRLVVAPLAPTTNATRPRAAGTSPAARLVGTLSANAAERSRPITAGNRAQRLAALQRKLHRAHAAILTLGTTRSRLIRIRNLASAQLATLDRPEYRPKLGQKKAFSGSRAGKPLKAIA